MTDPRAADLAIDAPALSALRSSGICRVGLIAISESGWSVVADSPAVFLVLEGIGDCSWETGCAQAVRSMLLVVESGRTVRFSSGGGGMTVLRIALTRHNRWESILGGKNEMRTVRGDPARMESLLRHLLFDSRSAAPERTAMARLGAELFLRLLDLRFREIADKAPSPRVPQLREYWNHVAAALGDAWSNAELARGYGSSTGHFHRLCRTAFGLSPQRLLNRLRMEKAEELLMASERPIRSIAYALGFADPFAFSTAFKRFYGMSPRAYRARSKEHDRPKMAEGAQEHEYVPGDVAAAAGLAAVPDGAQRVGDAARDQPRNGGGGNGGE